MYIAKLFFVTQPKMNINCYGFEIISMNLLRYVKDNVRN